MVYKVRTGVWAGAKILSRGSPWEMFRHAQISLPLDTYFYVIEGMNGGLACIELPAIVVSAHRQALLRGRWRTATGDPLCLYG